MHRICVFAGSNPGTGSEFREGARALGKALVGHGLELVYGGSNVGLMGEVADAVLEGGGSVIGVIPRHLFPANEIHEHVTQLIEVKDIHERKAVMGQLADAFVGLPGAYGTLEEVFEVVTWATLGIYQKPIALVNLGGYYDPLLALADRMVEMGFLDAVHRSLLGSVPDPESLMAHLRAHDRSNLAG